jgi:hypothetical protein
MAEICTSHLVCGRLVFAELLTIVGCEIRRFEVNGHIVVPEREVTVCVAKPCTRASGRRVRR